MHLRTGVEVRRQDFRAMAWKCYTVGSSTVHMHGAHNREMHYTNGERQHQQVLKPQDQ